MKLLGSQAILGGIEAKESFNCLECSVHAWSKRLSVLSVSPELQRAETLMCW